MKNLHSKSLIIGIVTGIINGIFGSGGGTILVPSLVFIMNVDDHKAHATAISVILPISIISSVIYYKYNIVDFSITFKIILGSVIGSFVGSTFLPKVPVKILRKVFGTFMILAGIRMVL